GILAALSSAGLPLTFGFIGKDLIYEATLHTTGTLTIVLTVLAVLTNILLLCAGFLAGIKPFAGKLPERFSQVHLPHGLMWGAPLLLAVLGVVFGCAPWLADSSLLNPAAQAMHQSTIDSPLQLWHGFNLVLLLSGVTLALGILLYFVRKPSAASLASIERYNTVSPKHVIGQLARYARKISITYTRTLHNGYLRVYLLYIIVAAIVLFAVRLVTGGPIRLTVDNLSPVGVYEVVVAAILIAAVYITVTASSRLTVVVATSVLGYCVCLLFVFYSAPDLAMTQFSIDTLTVVLFVLVLFRLPPFLNFANRKIR